MTYEKVQKLLQAISDRTIDKRLQWHNIDDELTCNTAGVKLVFSSNKRSSWDYSGTLRVVCDGETLLSIHSDSTHMVRSIWTLARSSADCFAEPILEDMLDQLLLKTPVDESNLEINREE